ncbi:MAG: hypothetical protein VCD34_01290 [Planctomycetota bacterium]|jgi:hypothetical protein
MALSINVPDKILAGLNQSYTITSDSGEPSGSVSVAGTELAHRIVPLGPPKDTEESAPLDYKYKVTFLLPADSVGSQLELKFSAGESEVEEAHEVIPE